MNANENDSAFGFMKNIPLPIIQEKNMNQRIERLLESAPYTTISTEGRLFSQRDMARFAQLLLANLADELSDVAQRSKKVNPECAGWCIFSNNVLDDSFCGVFIISFILKGLLISGCG